MTDALAVVGGGANNGQKIYDRMEIKKYIQKISVFIATIIIIPIIIALLWQFGKFYCIFNTHPFSINISDWGNFGDYLSGTVGIILSAFNIYLLIDLTRKTNKKDDNRLLNEFRHTAYLVWIEQGAGLEDRKKLINFTNSFLNKYDFLFQVKDCAPPLDFIKSVFEKKDREIDELEKNIKYSENYIKELEKHPVVQTSNEITLDSGPSIEHHRNNIEAKKSEQHIAEEVFKEASIDFVKILQLIMLDKNYKIKEMINKYEKSKVRNDFA